MYEVQDVRLPAHWLWQEPVLPNPAISIGAQTGGNKAILIVFPLVTLMEDY